MEIRRIFHWGLAAMAGGLALSAEAACFDVAERESGIPTPVLRAIVAEESSFNPQAVHVNKDGSKDIGYIQVNTSHLAGLGKYGITEQSLKDACTNLRVGAWILSQEVARLGWSWEAIGAFNVGCKKLDAKTCSQRRSEYAWRIHRRLVRMGYLVPARKAGLNSGGYKVASLGRQYERAGQ